MYIDIRSLYHISLLLMQNKTATNCITGKSKVEPQIFFSVKCFDRINPKKFSPLKYCVIWYDKAVDTI